MTKPDDAHSGAAPVKAPARVAAFRTGLSAEARAAAFLMAKGYRRGAFARPIARSTSWRSGAT